MQARSLLAAVLLTFSCTLSGCDGCDGRSEQHDREVAAAAVAQASNQAREQERMLEQRRVDEENRLAEQRRQQLAVQYRTCIENVLTIDDQISKRGYTLSQVPGAMERIDTSGCPAEFRAAYVDHTGAWQDLVRVTAAKVNHDSDDNVQSVLIQSLFANASNSTATPLQDALKKDQTLSDQQREASQEISDTFRTVKKIAVMYGASLPGAQ